MSDDRTPQGETGPHGDPRRPAVSLRTGIGGIIEHMMGTAVGIDVRPADDGTAPDPMVVDGAFTWLRWVEDTFSVFRPDSEVSRLGRGELSLDDAHPYVREVLVRCEEMEELSDGAFTVRAVRSGPAAHPSTGGLGVVLDPSGLVKGWSVQLAAQMLRMGGVRRACINAGGDMVCLGGPAAGRGWRVGIRHPEQLDRHATVVEVVDAAVATSGTYERGEHIWRSGGSGGLVSVTVVGADLGPADALATALLAAGTDEPRWLARWLARFPVDQIITITDDGRLRRAA